MQLKHWVVNNIILLLGCTNSIRFVPTYAKTAKPRLDVSKKVLTSTLKYILQALFVHFDKSFHWKEVTSLYLFFPSLGDIDNQVLYFFIVKLKYFFLKVNLSNSTYSVTIFQIKEGQVGLKFKMKIFHVFEPKKVTFKKRYFTS